MNKMKRFSGSLLILLAMTSSLFLQKNLWAFFQDTAINPGLKAEYFGLTLQWDEKAYSSKFTSYLFTLDTEFQVVDGLSIHLLLGYSLSKFEGLTFRQLPFSVEMGDDHIGGCVIGTEIDKKILHFTDYELGLTGQFIYSFRLNKREWEVPDLNVEGTVSGSPSWFRAQIGPVIRYLGFDYFFPYISIKYNKLWGRFKLEQEIMELTGTEKKTITSMNDFILLIGALYELTDTFVVTAEVTFLPYSDGLDIGAKACFRYRF